MPVTEEELRKIAIKRVHNGENVRSVSSSLGRSHTWIYKWLSRAKDGTSDWWRSQSRAPHRPARRLSQEVKDLIIETRLNLEKRKYCQKGVMAIQWVFHQQGLPVPKPWQINRTLKEAGLVHRSQKRESKGREYPLVGVKAHGSVQEMDLWGPRYIKGDGRFWSLDIIDRYSHVVGINPIRTKTDEDIVTSMIKIWNRIGIPDFLKMDNELPFHGSNRYPRSFGKVIRLSLINHVIPIFVPIREPWRQGVIEHFHNVLNDQFFRGTTFRSFQHLKSEAPIFEQFHNANHRYSILGGKTPDKVRREEGDLPSGRYSVKTGGIQKSNPLDFGKIWVIRFIRSDLILNIFSERINMPKYLMYTYVIAEIDLFDKMLYVLDTNFELLERFGYTLI